MESLSQIVFCILMLMVSLPYDVAAQRGAPIIKKPDPQAPAIPLVEEHDVQGNNGEVAGDIQVKATDDEAMRHIEDLQNTITIMKQEKVQMQQAMNSLRLSVINLQRTMTVIATKVSENDKLANQNKELTRLLTYFETFFGVLYSEVPEAFDNTIPVETRLSKMTTYLGNKEAQLAGLRPQPRVAVEPEPCGISNQVASAVEQLSQENSNLASKITNLETSVETTNVEVEKAKAKSVGFGVGTGSCTCGENTESRLETVEEAVGVLLSSSAANSVSVSSPTSKNKAPTTISHIDEEDLNNWRSLLAERRSATSTRKSVFSAIRHIPMIGDDERQVLSFDTVHVNKGSNFQNNTIFVCTVDGFYFFHFTVRSYDGHYMGVALVKNSEMMTSVYTDASERSIMQSQSTVLHMTVGDMVWLELGSSERFAVHSDVHKYITFNGFLIYKGR